MPRPDLEHLDIASLEWTPVPDEEGLWEMILSEDPDTGSHTRLLRFDPGYESDKVLVHDFWEETYGISGAMIDLDLGYVFKEGSYSCVPPGKKHGPYKSPEGYFSIEFRYYV